MEGRGGLTGRLFRMGVSPLRESRQYTDSVPLCGFWFIPRVRASFLFLEHTHTSTAHIHRT